MEMVLVMISTDRGNRFGRSVWGLIPLVTLWVLCMTQTVSLQGPQVAQEWMWKNKPSGKWLHVKETTEIGEGKMFSPGNLRATFDNPDYKKLINYYVKEKYTLRYTGGMVLDVNQIIVKEKGVFTNVLSPTTKAKLRLLFEVAPLGFLIEKAGGYSSDGTKSVLDKVVNVLDELYGSKKYYMVPQDSRLPNQLLFKPPPFVSKHESYPEKVYIRILSHQSHIERITYNI